MASVWKHKNSRFWSACYTDRDGRQMKRSTKQVDKKTAQLIAVEYERLETVARKSGINSGLANSSSDDDPNGGLSVGGFGASSGDQPGGSGIFQGPQLIPATFHFTWTAVCIKGCCAGKVLSQTSRDYHLWLYTGAFIPPAPPAPPWDITTQGTGYGFYP